MSAEFKSGLFRGFLKHKDTVNTMHGQRISQIFYLAALYDGLLGLAFLLAPYGIYGWAGVEPPNHIGYVQFPALLLLIFAWMFFQIAKAPLQRRQLIPYGIARLPMCWWCWAIG